MIDTLAYETKFGRAYNGRCEEILKAISRSCRKKVQLILTSPPFPLNTKKRYGNLKGQQYLDWIASFAPLFRDQVREDGSIVLELGNAWEPGQPTMSTLSIEALLAFKKKADLYLCQEFVCFNPARLPSPAQWVTIERCRVKDAFTRVWWMSPTPRPKADNRRVLTEYSRAMRRLLEKGTYNSGIRPSEHNIGGTSFFNDHGGAIPPNVLVPPLASSIAEIWSAFPDLVELLPISNTSNGDPYQTYCKKHGVKPHPARMPSKLVEFFVRFLTDPGDLVMDPFAGSNTTGAVAEMLRRRWISIEVQKDYVSASKSRFTADNRTKHPSREWHRSAEQISLQLA